MPKKTFKIKNEGVEHLFFFQKFKKTQKENQAFDPSVFFSIAIFKMMLFSLHSIFTQPTVSQTDNRLLSYVQKTNVNEFNIVNFFQYFGFKERNPANATFKELISVIMNQSKPGKDILEFAQSHYINDYAVSVNFLYIDYSILKSVIFF